jgi:RNA polymerase sigma-70 factor, ECF subfamily
LQSVYSELESANDDLLVQLAKEGEPAATDVLFSRHIPVLRNTARRFLRNEAEADDVVQDSLTSAFVHLSQFAGHAQFRTWLLSILLNAARSRVRSQRRERSVSLDEILQGPNPGIVMRMHASTPGQDQILTLQERRRLVSQSLKELSPNFRTAYYLCYVKGMSASAAAAALGVNRETFKVRLLRGKRKLLAKLSQAGSPAASSTSTSQKEDGNPRVRSKRDRTASQAAADRPRRAQSGFPYPPGRSHECARTQPYRGISAQCCNPIC